MVWEGVWLCVGMSLLIFRQYINMKFIAPTLLAGTAAAFSPSTHSPHHTLCLTRLNARKPFISGNWKLNPQTKEEALSLGKEIAASITEDTPDVDVALFVPYVFIESTMGVVGDKLSVGAEVRTGTIHCQ